MKKCLSIFFILCYFQYPSFSQDQHLIDSLFAVLKAQKDDATKVKTLNQLAYEFRGNDPDTAVYFGNEALELATKLNYKMGIAGAYLLLSNAKMNMGEYDDALKNNKEALKIYEQLLSSEKSVDKASILKKKADTYSSIGVNYWHQGNFSQALKNHSAALKIREEIRDEQGISLSLNNIGIIYSEQPNYPEALKYFFAALKIREQIGDKENIAASYTNIGVIYAEQNNYPEALKNFLAALKIFEQIGDKKDIATSFSNIGALYDAQGNYPEALKNDTLALKIQEEIGDKRGIATTLENIGINYSIQGNHPQALKNLFASLKSKEEMGDKQGIALSYNNIGNVYILQKNTSEAYQYLNKGLSLAKEINNLEAINYNYLSLAELDSAQGNFKQALEHYKLFITYRDSLFNEDITKKSVQQQMQYEFDKRETVTRVEQEKKDVIVQQQFQKQKVIRNSFIAGSILLILLIVVLINRNKLKRKVEMEKMRSRLSRDLHDDIGSTLSSINILSRTAQNNLKQTNDENTKASLEKINERSQRLLDNMSDIIWNINPVNDTIEEVMSRMREYATTILEAKNIDYTFDFPKVKMDCKLTMGVKNNMYLIFKEAVNNLSKYSGCTKANLSLTFDEKNIHLKIEDKGNGFELNTNENGVFSSPCGRSGGAGLRNMQHRAEEIKGAIKIKSVIEKGTVVELSMPRYC